MPIPKKIPPPVTPNTQQEETTTLQKQPYIPPFLRTKDEHPPPLLAPQTTPQDTQNQPPKQKPLNAASDDGFAEKTSQFRDEKRMEGAIIAAKPPNEDDDDDFGAYKSLLHSVERQKKAVGPKFPKDYEDESPPSPSVLAAAKHGDQKSLEGQEKVTTGGGQKIGLKDFVEGGEKLGVKNKTTAEVDQSVKKTSMTTSGGGGDFRLGKAAEAVKGGGVSDPKEERQLLVNAGVAVLVILALGAYIYNTVGTRKSD
nr:inactive protein RESTRICTED TEV MOVEMENT 2-like [Ipomoea batatas]